MKRLNIALCAIGWLGMMAAFGVPAGEPHGDGHRVVAFELVDEHGRAFETYPVSSGDSYTHRAYVEARRQARYSIRVRNLTSARVGLVIAVDGRNIISGERSELKRNEAMYVLDPYDSATYAGWRTSGDEVRRFYFTNVEDSYAGRIGDESAVGVVAAAVYEERVRTQRMWQSRSGADSAAAPAPAAEAQDRADALAERSAQAGTGFGEAERSRAIRVAFAPARRPVERSFLKYEWPEQICVRGLKRCEPTNRFWPEPSRGFVPLPPARTP